MTIDEAIQQARYVAYEHSDCWRNCENLDKCCNECEYEHKQLAEWLEELKALRHDAHQWAKAGYAHGHSVGYNKSIDDLREKLMQSGFIFNNMH